VTTPSVEQQDFVLVSSDGIPLYNFGAVARDDMLMEVSARGAAGSHDQHAAADHALRGLRGSVPEFAHLLTIRAERPEVQQA
jgi:glutamyl/glutaminyl-tRNA synthetase